MSASLAKTVAEPTGTQQPAPTSREIDTEAAQRLSDEAVDEHWGRLCELPAVVDRKNRRVSELNFVTPFFHVTERSDLVLIVFCGDASTQRRIVSRLNGEGSEN